MPQMLLILEMLLIRLLQFQFHLQLLCLVVVFFLARATNFKVPSSELCAGSKCDGGAVQCSCYYYLGMYSKQEEVFGLTPKSYINY